MMLFIVTLVIIGCAILAAMGFKGRVTTIGVDLGTTFSVVAFNQKKSVRIISDNYGNVLFPSVVSYVSPTDLVVGYEAVRKLESNPQNTIFNSKRFIGRSWNDDIIQSYGSAHPYNIVECDKSISNYSSVGFQLLFDNGEKKVVSPETVATDVLRHLLDVTSKFLGHSQVSKAVIAVPAKFGSQQRIATGEAYRAAGIKVVRVIEEPTAAAVAYDLHKKPNVHHILVYDFGGGTLDVSMLYVAKGSVQVYATDGDENLGGSDFDMCIYGILTEKIADTYDVDWTSFERQQHTSHSFEGERSKDLCLPSTIRQKSEKIKKHLSSSSTASFSCLLDMRLFKSELAPAPASAALVLVDLDFSLELFHSGCKHLFDRGMVPVRRILDDLGMTPETVDEVVLVGGTTRIPFVKEMLKNFFGKVELNDQIDPDITVAYGAASIID